MFEKTTGQSPAETYQSIDDLAAQSRLSNKEAVVKAITWLMQGLELINAQDINNIDRN